MVSAIRNAVGNPDIPVRRFPWWLVTLASPFVTLFREMYEMRYLWKVPLHMTNRKLVKVLGDDPHTDWESAVRATLRGMGSLPA